MRQFLVAALLCILASLTGCAEIVRAPEASSVPDGQLSMVFGSQKLFRNDLPVPEKGFTLVSAAIMSHVDFYKGSSELNTDAYKPGKYAIKALLKDDGFFSVALPPGRYYFVEFIYVAFDLGNRPIGYRTYTPIMGNQIFHPTVVTFDVLPGRATYIGNLEHRLSDAGTPGFAINQVIRDDFPAARERFSKLYPAWSGVTEEHLMQVQTMAN